MQYFDLEYGYWSEKKQRMFEGVEQRFNTLEELKREASMFVRSDHRRYTRILDSNKLVYEIKWTDEGLVENDCLTRSIETSNI